MLAERDLMWLAGFLEGEGTFVSSRRRNAQGRDYVQPRIQAYSTDLDVLQRAQRVSGVGRVCGPLKNSRPDRYKDRYCWSVSRQAEVYPLLEALLPHMGERRAARIRELLAIRTASAMRAHVRPSARMMSAT